MIQLPIDVGWMSSFIPFQAWAGIATLASCEQRYFLSLQKTAVFLFVKKVHT